VLQADVVIQPGETLSFDVFVGIALHEGDPSGIVARYGEPGVVDEKLEAVKRYWDSYLSKLTVATPDPDVNRAVNIWDKYQAWVSIRSAGMQSLYRGGASVIGFRESCFDTFAALPMDYDVSKHRIVSLMQHQHRDGSAVHYWEPRSDVGPRTGQLDDSLWLAFATVNYVKETGDLDFLDDRIKCYYSQSPATVYEHLIKALDFCLSQMSSRGLALLGPGDWNDALDQAGRGGKGESIVTSMMLCRMLTEAAEVARLMGDPARERGWIARAREIRKRVNEVGWDGKWYIRATDDKGEAIGSSANASGKTYSTPQSWAVISETAPVERAVQAMDSVREHLETPYGPALVLPAYQRADARIGTSTRFSPGMRENGGISTLAACWAIIAECKLGHGARAHEILKKTLHSTRAEDPERYLVEPYAHSEYVAGPDSDVFGRGGFTWAPGVAAWVWRTCIDWICGVRPDYKGLIVDPCVPPGWKEFSVVRPFREAEYRITVHNPNGVEKGVIEVTVDGKKPRTNHHIPAYKDRKVHEVEVLMG
jgi:cellobiose phosphorylase